jgi:uncharacterized protein
MSNVAVIGASADKSKYGNKCVRAFVDSDYDVYPVNPKEKEIEGLKCYQSVVDIKDKIDIASVYLPPEIGLKVADDIIKKGIETVYLNPGSESKELISKLEKAGIKVLALCSIIAIGKTPSDY